MADFYEGRRGREKQSILVIYARVTFNIHKQLFLCIIPKWFFHL